MSESLISIRHLKVELMSVQGLVYAVRDINLDIAPGEIHGIVGESGCGKSMTAKSILRLHDEKKMAYSGEILLDGERDILKMNKKELQQLRGKEISMIFQDPITTMNPLHTVGKQIMEMMLLHMNISKEEAKRRAVELLEKVGIFPGEERFKQYPFEMSGGMLQRASIAMSLACSPRLLIADEPTTALDVTIQTQILELLQRLNRERGMSVLFISHNLNVVRKLCARVAVMEKGLIVEQGDTEQVFHNPQAPYTQRLIAAIPTRKKLW